MSILLFFRIWCILLLCSKVILNILCTCLSRSNYTATIQRRVPASSSIKREFSLKNRSKKKEMTTINFDNVFLTKKATRIANFLSIWLEYKLWFLQNQHDQMMVIFSSNKSFYSNNNFNNDIVFGRLYTDLWIFENLVLCECRILVGQKRIKELCKGVIDGSLLNRFEWLTQTFLTTSSHKLDDNDQGQAKSFEYQCEPSDLPSKNQEPIMKFFVERFMCNPHLAKKAIKSILFQFQIRDFYDYMVNELLPHIISHIPLKANNDSSKAIKLFFMNLLNSIWRVQESDQPRLNFTKDFLNIFLGKITTTIHAFDQKYLEKDDKAIVQVAIKLYYLTFVRHDYWDEDTKIMIVNHVFGLGFQEQWKSKVDHNFCAALNSLLREMRLAQWGEEY